MSTADYFSIIASILASASAVATYVLARKTVAAEKSREGDAVGHADPAFHFADKAEVVSEIEEILRGLSRRKIQYDDKTIFIGIALFVMVSMVTAGLLYVSIGFTYLFLLVAALFLASSAYFAFVSVAKIRSRHFWAMRKGDMMRMTYIVNNYLHTMKDARDMRVLLVQSLPRGDAIVIFDTIVFEEFSKRAREN